MNSEPVIYTDFVLCKFASYYEDGKEVKGVVEYDAMCPNCKRVFSEEDEQDLWEANYCIDCGQKLEWPTLRQSQIREIIKQCSRYESEIRNDND